MLVSAFLQRDFEDSTEHFLSCWNILIMDSEALQKVG